MRTNASIRTLTVLGTGFLLVTVFAFTAQAHKAVTSPYTYNDHVFAILRDKCGRCHVDGGPAPMSLLVYKTTEGGGAFAWAQSMREMLVSGAMPPWYVDPRGPAVRRMHGLTPRELDILVNWASGGTPEGDPARKPAATPMNVHWRLGEPDLVLRMSAGHTVKANTLEETVDLTLPTNVPDAKWVKSADLRPGAPAMVRRATISVEGGPVLEVWEPGDDSAAAPGGTAFRLPPSAQLHLQMVYKKPWREEAQDKTDLSSVGLYFTDAPQSGKGIDAFTVDGPKLEGEAPRQFTGTVPAAGRVLAIRPQLDAPYESMDITAVGPSGKRVPMLKLFAARPEWPRRYWLADPVELPKGTKIEVTGVPADPDRGPLVKAASTPLRVAFDFVTP